MTENFQKTINIATKVLPILFEKLTKQTTEEEWRPIKVTYVHIYNSISIHPLMSNQMHRKSLYWNKLFNFYPSKKWVRKRKIAKRKIKTKGFHVHLNFLHTKQILHFLYNLFCKKKISISSHPKIDTLDNCNVNTDNPSIL